MSPITWVFIASVGLNLALTAGLQHQNQRMGALRTELNVAREAARQCNEKVEEMEQQAQKRAKEAAIAIEAARRKSRTHNERADRHLATPGLRPGDACGSARLRLDEWWEERK
jgi:hypothetical protein